MARLPPWTVRIDVTSVISNAPLSRISDVGTRADKVAMPGIRGISRVPRAQPPSGLTELALFAIRVNGAAGGDGTGPAAGVHLGVEERAGHAGGYGFYQVSCPGGIGVVG